MHSCGVWGGFAAVGHQIFAALTFVCGWLFGAVQGTLLLSAATFLVSDTVPEDPVFAVKTGLLYSRRLIEKSIDADGKCPVSGEELTADDLTTVKGAHNCSSATVVLLGAAAVCRGA